jgi:hypothetical protein
MDIQSTVTIEGNLTHMIDNLGDLGDLGDENAQHAYQNLKTLMSA